MSSTYNGVVQFANGVPAPDVHVRLFDRDLIGSDDDLTIQPGKSDKNGHFSVVYLQDRDLDFLDVFLPNLRFDYKINGRSRTHHAFIQPMTNVHRLPEMTPVKFIPSKHGFQFTNRFPGFWLPFSVPSIPDIPPINKNDIYGLCGGMSAAALDFLDHDRPIPLRRRVPGRAQPLHQYIHQRQVDSLGRFGRQVERFVRWMILTDAAVQKRTGVAFEKLKQTLDNGRPTPIGLVYISSKDSLQVWKNHQVLACNYQVENGVISIQVYDPNFPRRDDVFIICKPDGQNGLQSEQTIGDDRKKNVRGFFVMPYESVEPPAALTQQS